MRSALSTLLLLVAIGTPLPLFAQEQPFISAADLTIEGRGFGDTAEPWDRLPARAEQLVRPPVWQLSRDSAGFVVRFRTDAGRIAVRYALRKAGLAMPHMSASGVSGFDLYVRRGESWRWIAATRPPTQTGESVLVDGLPPEDREFALYLPLYNGVKELALGVPADTSLRAADRRTALPVVFYGTSITQGACASRPGACHVAILGRRLDRPTINLGFSGQGRMDLELADLLAEIDAAVYVVDCLPNMNAEMVRERATVFLRRLRTARPEVPVIVVEDRTMPRARLVPEMMARHDRAREALRSALREIENDDASGMVLLIPGDDLLGDDGEATVDGSHPTDLGFVRMADALEPALRTALASSSARPR